MTIKFYQITFDTTASIYTTVLDGKNKFTFKVPGNVIIQVRATYINYTVPIKSTEQNTALGNTSAKRTRGVMK